MDISDKIRYVGADDVTLDLFESQYPVPYGVSYNSYVILDEKTTIMDTVDKRATEPWLSNLSDVLKDVKPTYLVVSHMEPDHSGSVQTLCQKYPDMKLVGNAKTFQFLKQFTDIPNLEEREVTVKEGDRLSLGEHTLTFVMAPMIHWPEVMVSYEEKEKVLFSADAFGTFGAIEEDINWLVEARRYYINIVGKYGAPVQNLLKKAAALDIEAIAPLHGPVLSENLSFYIGKYDLWSRYQPEGHGIVLCYASIHGNTKAAALRFAQELEEAGAHVKTFDLCRDDMSRAVEAAFEYDRLVLASVTYDGNLFPAMEDFLYHLKIKDFQNRRVGLIENGTWGPLAAKVMRSELEGMKNITLCDTTVTIRSSRKPENEAAFQSLKQELMETI